MKKYIIDPNSRTLSSTNPKAAFAICGDNETDYVEFQLDGEIVSEISSFPIYVKYSIGDDTTVYSVLLNNKTTSGNTMNIKWKLGSSVTNAVGRIVFALCFFKPDGKMWNTYPYTDKVLNGMNRELDEEETEEINNYYDSIVENLSRYMEELLLTIPSDYSNLVETVSKNEEDIETVKSDVDMLKNGTPEIDYEAVGDQIKEWMDEHPEKVVNITDGSITESKLSNEVKEKIENSGMFIGSVVSWVEPSMDIINKVRREKHIRLSENGHLAHNSCVCQIQSGFAVAWSEDTSGGTNDNQQSNNVHGKLRFVRDPWGTIAKIDGEDIEIYNENVYSIFPYGKSIGTYTIVSDSDHAMLYDGGTLHVFGMVKCSDNNVRIAHTTFSITTSGTGSNRSLTCVPSEVYDEVKLIYNGVTGEYDFSRIDSSWMKVPQINTSFFNKNGTVKFALSINGKAVVLIKTNISNPTSWEYITSIDAPDINLEASYTEINYQSNNVPTGIIAYRTKKGYAKLIGINSSNYSVLQTYSIPASNSRVRVYTEKNISGSYTNKAFLIFENIGRCSSSIAMMDMSLTCDMSMPTVIWHSEGNIITDYVDIFQNGDTMVVVGTNGSAKSKNGISIASVVWNTESNNYVNLDNKLESILKGVVDVPVVQTITSGEEIGKVNGVTLYAPRSSAGGSSEWTLIGESELSETSSECYVSVDSEKYNELKVYVYSKASSESSTNGRGILVLNDNKTVCDGMDNNAMTANSERHFLYDVQLMPDMCIGTTLMQTVIGSGYSSEKVTMYTNDTIDNNTPITKVSFKANQFSSNILASGTRIKVYAR